jgi:hypothetical protein
MYGLQLTFFFNAYETAVTSFYKGFIKKMMIGDPDILFVVELVYCIPEL